jgi:hypothetical protein
MQSNLSPNIFQTILQIIFIPSYFFSRLSSDPNRHALRKAVLHYSLFSLFFLITRSLSIFFFIGSYFKLIGFFMGLENISVPQFQIFPLIVNALLTLPFTVLMSFVFAGILYVYCKLLGSKMPFYKSYQLYAYAKVPNLVLGWIPFLGFFMGIYTFILLVVGAEHLHGFSKKKSVFIFLIPGTVLFIVFLTLITFLFYSLTGNVALPEVPKL